ncbi:hypothetical protein EVAR_4389_1 [Eumeta japonica]|uniref:Uncharacterized protein n=1 Tax=Eumeta variegata TaxID=151549 RepID=A0A4C1T0C5_EUMVA|nr:hypothetical protein EVAR_4389_1 [Eumeta japonica]
MVATQIASRRNSCGAGAAPEYKGDAVGQRTEVGELPRAPSTCLNLFDTILVWFIEFDVNGSEMVHFLPSPHSSIHHRHVPAQRTGNALVNPQGLHILRNVQTVTSPRVSEVLKLSTNALPVTSSDQIKGRAEFSPLPTPDFNVAPFVAVSSAFVTHYGGVLHTSVRSPTPGGALPRPHPHPASRCHVLPRIQAAKMDISTKQPELEPP